MFLGLQTTFKYLVIDIIDKKTTTQIGDFHYINYYRLQTVDLDKQYLKSVGAFCHMLKRHGEVLRQSGKRRYIYKAYVEDVTISERKLYQTFLFSLHTFFDEVDTPVYGKSLRQITTLMLNV